MGADLFVRFIGLDLVSRVAERAGNSIDRMENRIKKGGIATAQSLIATGIAATTFGVSLIAIAGGMAAIAENSVMAAAQFKSDMVMTVTHAGLAKNEVGAVTDAIMAMAPAVGFGPDALAQAFYHVQSAVTSLDPKFQTLAGRESILYESAKLAAIGHANLTDTTNTVIGVLAAYHGKITDAAGAAAQLNAIVGNGNVTMQQFDSAMRGGLLPIAADSGVALNSLGAAFGSLTDMSYGASQAATYLRSAIIQMAMPSGQAAKALEEIGLSGDDVAKRMGYFNETLKKAGVTQTEVAEALHKRGNLSDAIKLLTDHLTAAGIKGPQAVAMIEKAFGGVRSGAGMVGLSNNLQSLIDKENKIIQSKDEWAATWQYFQAEDPAFAFKQMNASLEVLRITLGNALMPVFLAFANFIGPMVGKIRDWIKTHEHLTRVIVIGGIALSAMLGTLLIVAGGALILAGGLGVLAGVVGGLLAPIGEFVGAFALFASIEGVGSAIGVAFGPLAPIIAAAVVAFVLIKSELGPITSSVNAFRDAWARTHDAVFAIEKALMAFGVAGRDAESIAHALTQSWSAAVSIFNLARDAIGRAADRIISSLPPERIAALNKAFGELAGAISTYVVPAIGLLVLFIGSLVGGVFSGLVNALSYLIPGAIQLMAGAFQFAAGLINLFGANIQFLISIADDIFHGRWGRLMKDFEDYTRNMHAAVSQILNGLGDIIIGLFTTVFGTVLGFVTGFVTGVVGAFQNLYDILVGHSIIPDLCDAITTWFTNLPGRIVGALDGGLGAVAGAASRIGSTIWNTLTSKLAGIGAWISSQLQFHGSVTINGGDSGLPVTGGGDIIANAAGGYYERPTLAVLGEAGGEYVIPKSRMRDSAGLGGIGRGDNSDVVSVLQAIHAELVAQRRQSNSRMPSGADSSSLLDSAMKTLTERADRGRRNGMRGVFA